MSGQPAAGGAGFFWSDRAAWGGRRAPALALAKLRRASGQPPGTVPSVWPFYRASGVEGGVSVELHAEHIALGLFAAHQRVRSDPVHVPGREFADVLGRLRVLDPRAAPALDRRFSAAVTSATRSELAAHLPSLISRLRRLPKNGFDYDRFYRDICDWEDPHFLPSIRWRWGAGYFVAKRAGAGPPTGTHFTSLR
ncbi:type I-E CRISPR-associated protein Cse2/CasB [Nocardia brasiliensis]|uniref:type I-E CRISPR-associated protein Cse2/CasB n=1 Tax=Nocardia brasiliensis TaxID=37326 RepID=UPI0024562234|nr:type I-E CRISPR-associated protein Cse2/CasB [Nocardia brasiliensis]